MAGTCKNMRLRLVVRRHNLPETRVLFSVSLENDPTISQLLEQINAVIPLESDHWGLDDYAVELRTGPDGAAFEALHYQHVATILQHDEEVYIRPLLTPDLKKRRLSGRDQISTDGRHLVDGVPYGRPLLRHQLNRPSIHIPPRKRQRLLSDDQDDEDNLSGEQPPLQITQYGEPEWQGGEDDDSDFSEHEAEEDMELDEQLSEIDEDELTALHQDNVEAGLETGVESEIQKSPSPNSKHSDRDPWYEEEDSGMTGSGIEDDHRRADELKRQLLGTLYPAFITSSPEDTPKWVHKYPKNLYSNDMSENLAILDLLACLGTAFPGRPMLDLMKIMIQCEYKARRVYKRLKKDDIPHMSYNRVKRLYKAIHTSASAEAYEFINNQMDKQQQPDKEDAPVASSRDEDMMEASNGADIDDEDNQSESGDSVSSLVKYYDQHGFPPGSIHDGTALTHMAAAAQGGKPRKINLEDNQPAKAEAGTAPSQDSDSDSEEDDDFEADSESDSDDSEYEPAEDLKPEQHMDATSDSSSDSELEDKENEILATASKKALPLSDSPGEDSSADSSDDEDVQTTKFEGKPRKISTAAPDTSGSESGSEDEEAEDSSGSDSDDDSESSFDDSEDSSDSEDEGPEEVSSKQPTSDPALDRSEPPNLNESKSSKSGNLGQPSKSVANADNHENSSIVSQPGKAKTRSRNARRRALKQALKAKATTAAAEIDPLEERKKELLAALGTSGSPEKPASPSASTGTAKATTSMRAEADIEEPDAWRAKINYRAVECVEEGVELSEPPFPFVQRWDPQQRGYGRGGKRKRRAAADYYQVGDVGHSATKKLKFADVNGHEEDVTFLNYDDEEEGHGDPGGNGTDDKDTRGNEPEFSAADSQFTDLDDLPSLPSDLSTLPLLKLGDAKPGMVITWKKWVLSEATSWQPQLADVSAIVASVSDDGMQLRVVLARRDRNMDKKEKTYDEETGERIYGRFEVPDDDEDDDGQQRSGEEDEDGWRTLELSDLIDPRIQQRPLPSDRGGSEDGHNDMQADAPGTRPNGSVVIPDSQALTQPNDRVEHRSTSNEISTTVEGDGEEAGQVSGEDGNQVESRTEETNNGPKPAGIRQPSTAHSAQDESVVPETAESSLVAAHAAQDNRPEADETTLSVDDDEQARRAMESGTSRAVSHEDIRNDQQQQHNLDSPSRQLENDVSTTVQKEGLEDGDSGHETSCQPMSNAVQHSALVTQASHGSASQEVCYPSVQPSTSSAACSLRSGRQPDSGLQTIGSEDDIGIVDLDDVDESQVPTARAPQTPVKNRKDGNGSSSPSSLPSISTIWQTCPSTFGTRSPTSAGVAVASVSKAKADHVAQDTEYQEEMRRLDDDSDSPEDVTEYKISTTQIKESSSQQQQHDSSPTSLPRFKKESDLANPQTYGTSVSPPAPRGLRGVRRQGSTTKSLPGDHDQVITISSDNSSPEPVYVEDYADDSIDEDYESPEPVRASHSKRYGLRGASVPATRPSSHGGNVASADVKTVCGRATSAMPPSQPRAAGKYRSLRA
ncbi:uncharacterized protein PpBr36_10700 [Pyricularia pennisetigena]|uniref:uncharacterized protein n=1 Tax=Pyricularia pennisetigena TaxID=1578925 RepID=UPI00114EE2AB|nr:uncharacterized protein PpBr36_10700 [Pyricularia pennisetigena]TLS21037.1 hypothetical protein PpBr36_10700 [Pyricularia pennisetigena]